MFNMVRIFDIVNGKVIPSEHCYILKDLKVIIDNYPENYIDVFAYVFYMTCPNPELNPFFDVSETDRESLIFKQINNTFSSEDQVVIEAIAFCKKLYETPTLRSYMGIKKMLDRLAMYMETQSITDGRDGNINSIVSVAKNFDQIRSSFKGVNKDLMEEQQSTVRGGANLAYDQ
jgi:hypothetical protein